ncbi:MULTISPECIES: BRO family protein [unclassified Pseudomonas]|uniref:BRO family protein n=1 Tax=unclassified Pseudomonas TaxID=196821 RepID=UPI003917BFD4
MFVATQEARAAGLKDPANAVTKERRYHPKGGRLAPLIADCAVSLKVPSDELGRALPSTTVMFSEPEAYDMLMRGRAPQSEPFRKCVTEEVLPTIRRQASTTPNSPLIQSLRASWMS